MSCPVCDRTMQNPGTPDRKVFWCGWCGTLKEETGEFVKYELPSMLRHVVLAAKLPSAALDQTSQTSVAGEFTVRQVHKEPTPRIELTVRDSCGRRVV